MYNLNSRRKYRRSWRFIGTFLIKSQSSRLSEKQIFAMPGNINKIKTAGKFLYRDNEGWNDEKRAPGVCLRVTLRGWNFSTRNSADLLTYPAAGCIIFGSDQEVAGVMRAVRRCNATGAFSWIGSDGWSARGLVSDGNEPEVEGTLSVQPQANPVKGFEKYFLNLTVENNRRNPWFVGKRECGLDLP